VARTISEEALPDTTTKLKDLSPQELADLLDWPLDKARKWFEVAVSVSHVEELGSEPVFGDLELRPSLQRDSVRELMHLTVNEVKELKRTGQFYRRFPYFKSKVPKDTGTRLRYLRELLRGEVEFEARYPIAYRLLFGEDTTDVGFLLPSFNVRVLKNNPQESVLWRTWYGYWEEGQRSWDAYSWTGAEKYAGPPWTWNKKADQSLAPIDLGYMRGVLLAVLSREESFERLNTELRDEALREDVGASTSTSVRLTDLRLASARELEDKEFLKEELRPLLEDLERPVTTNKVLQWKWDVLFYDEVRSGQRTREEERKWDAKVKRVSFAAAALLLFVDFDMPELEGASSLRLANHIVTLADIVRKLSKSLSANAKSLEKLLAFRNANHPPTPGLELYDALVDYRMGEEPREIARDLGMNPYKSSPQEPGGEWGGTKEWKRRL
jgi:hypothetical protein